MIFRELIPDNVDQTISAGISLPRLYQSGIMYNTSVVIKDGNQKDYDGEALI